MSKNSVMCVKYADLGGKARQGAKMRVWMLVAMMMVGGMAVAETYKGNETPTYTVEKTDGPIEIRAYAPHIAAEVSVSGSRDAAVGAGFRLLAGYIFGGNEPKQKVAMTTPVTQSEKIAMTTPVTQTGGGNDWTVQFMMPAEYTLATLPKPKDSRIRFVTTESRRMAVLRFSGIATTAATTQRTAELRVWAAAQGLALQDPPQFFYYDAPFTLPWNRRNEVAFGLVN